MRLTTKFAVVVIGMASLVACGGDDVASVLPDGATSDGASDGKSSDAQSDAAGDAVDSGSSDGSADGSTDGALPDNGGGTAADAAPDVTLSEGSAGDASGGGGSDATVSDAGGGGDAPATAVDAPADTPVGTVVVVADGSLQTASPGSSCAAINFLSATPNETGVGFDITLAASGVDPSGQTGDVTLSWSATGTVGTLGGASGASNTFTCTSAGTATIIVTATIADGGASCPNIGSVMVTLTCDP